MSNTGKMSGTINKQWFLCQEKELFSDRKQKKLVIGMPNELNKGENRICLTPESVSVLISMGHEVMIQRGAGENAHYSDCEYAEVGGMIVETMREIYTADVVIKATSVSFPDTVYMHDRQVILSPLKLCDMRKDAMTGMMKKKITAIGFDILRDKKGGFPVVDIMSEIAGNLAIMIAGEYLSNCRGGKGVILGGVSGITPTEIVVLGAGTLGEFAARSALGLGATVKVFDHSVDCLRRLNEKLGQRIFTSVFHQPVLDRALTSADVLIGAMHCFNNSSSMVVTEGQVRLMKKGAVIVDMAIDQGGCIETSGPTTFEKPVYTYEGVIHYCVPNVLSRVARTASIACSNVFLPLLQDITRQGGFSNAIRLEEGLREGVYIYNGILTKNMIADRFGLVSRDIDLLMAAL
ncbi:MAG: alanine dehydrogenase [Odoribacter sp.]